MSLVSVKQQFDLMNWTFPIIEFEASTATVELAAEALGVEPGRIAKTMAIRQKEQDILVLAAGCARIDNRKYKDFFQEKAKFIGFDDVEAVTGHPVGGVCPFGLKQPLPIFLDESLKEFDVVYPAAGSPHSAVRLTVQQLAEITGGSWIDVCK